MIRSSNKHLRERGFYIIGLLIVLAIIFILYGKQLLPDKQGPGALTYIDRSKGSACMVNRTTLGTTIAAWQISHPGQKPTIEAMAGSGSSVPNCPQGGTYSIGDDGTVYCSKHFPPPAAEPTPPAAPGMLPASGPGIGPGAPAPLAATPFPPPPTMPAE